MFVTENSGLIPAEEIPNSPARSASYHITQLLSAKQRNVLLLLNRKDKTQIAQGCMFVTQNSGLILAYRALSWGYYPIYGIQDVERNEPRNKTNLPTYEFTN